MDSLLADTRIALEGAGVKAPYVLCPHSYSGIEALYWAQTYPDEIEAIIGLDMAVPEHYDYTKDGTLAVPYYGMLHGLLELGIGRYLHDSTFLPSGDFLTEEERKTWIALGNRNYANIDVARECNMELGELVHVIADCHIYDRHIPIVEEMITRNEFDAPKVYLNPDKKSFYDFTVDDLIVESYETNEQIKNIPVAI